MTGIEEPNRGHTIGSVTRPPAANFVLSVAEPPGKGLQRVALEQVDLIIWHVERVSIGDEHVHRVRKATKRVRAVLRMIRDELGQEAYRRDNVLVRDAARELSALRTATVELEILKGLAIWLPELAPAASQLQDRLAAQTAQIRAEMFTEPWLVDDMVGRFERVRENIAAWSLAPELVPTAHGLRHTYRHGRRAMARAYASKTGGRFHDWRKRVKYLRHQIEVLGPIQPALRPPLAVDLAELGEGLGLANDFADLEAMVSSTPGAVESDGGGQLVAAIADRRRSLQEGVRPLADQIYLLEPAEFARQMTTAWDQRLAGA